MTSNSNGQSSNGARRPYPESVRNHILAEIARGRKAAELAREFGVHPTTISGWKRAQSGSTASVAPVSPTVTPEDASGMVPPVVDTPPAAVSPPAADTAARETGRYSQAFKAEVLAQLRSDRKIAEVARQYELPPVTVSRWKHAAEDSGELPKPLSTRPESSGPSPIAEDHRELVLDLKGKFPKMGLAQIQNHLKRMEGVKLGRRIIARILTEAGIALEKPRKAADKRPEENRFEMTRPNELWAIDFTEFWIHSQKAYALFAIDDFSRFCVGFALTQNPTADLAIDTVEKAIQRHGRPERILSDRGPQFHAWNGVSRFSEFLADFLADHSVTKAGHAFTNGKVEAFHRTVHEETLGVEEFASLGETEAAIREFIARYNFARTHSGIGGLVPADRFFGMVEEAQRALHSGLKQLGSGLRWLKGLVSHDAAELRKPALLELLVNGGTLELVVLGRRFTIAQ